MDAPDALDALGDEQALYLYSLTRGPAPDVDHEGVSGNGVRSIRLSDTFGAVVDVVERGAWAGEEAEANMQSLAWIGPRATRHEEVVEHASEGGPVYPARFGTLFSTVERLRAAAETHAEALDAFFDRVTGANEWALKGFLNRQAAADQLAQEATASDDASNEASDDKPGTAYLKQRQQAQQARQEVDAWLEDVAAALQDDLAAVAADLRVLDPKRAIQADTDDPMALNWALLVATDDETALRRCVEQAREAYAAHGLSFRLTGPWPPYNFRPRLAADENDT
jgi:uncharacterized protein YggL (DUF469 family)